MNILCALFGHSPPVYRKKGWYSPGEEYGYVVVGAVDGIGRVHANIRGVCARCETEFTVCRVHLPEVKHGRKR